MQHNDGYGVVVLNSEITLASLPPETLQTRPEDIADWQRVAAGFLLGYAGRSRQAYTADLRDWTGWCAKRGLEPFAVSRGHVDAYVEMLRGRGAAPATIARRLSTLSGFYGYAVDEDLLARSPVARVRRPKVGEHSVSTGLSRAEYGALVATAEADCSRSLVVVLLLGLNGLRVSELTSANADDLGSERGHRILTIVRKGGRSARVPLAPRAGAALDVYLDGRTTGPLLTTSTGRRMDRHAVWRLLRRLAPTAVPDKATTLHPHDLRHAFVTLALDAGASLRDVQDAAGHADPRTTRRYDQARHNLDRHPTYALAALIANPSPGGS